jgi:hypothetical protein
MIDTALVGFDFVNQEQHEHDGRVYRDAHRETASEAAAAAELRGL